MGTIIAFAGGFFLDLIIGDPQGIWHPVQGIGWLIQRLERVLRKWLPADKKGEYIGGIILVIVVLGLSGGVPFLILILAGAIHPYLRIAAEMVMCAQILAMRSLKTESMKVKHAADRGDTEEARRAVSYIVGRDTKKLSDEGIIKAAIETVAENTSDGVIAPMLYLAIGGPVAGFLYKAVNTMDSMIGYKNDRYRWFGRAAARLDDLCNYVPARLSAWLMMAAALLAGMDWRGAIAVWRRDRRKHASPNAAQTEAVMAGALGIALAGDIWYAGQLYKKAQLGTAKRAAEPEDIRLANRLLYGTGVLAFLILLGARLVIFGRTI